MNTNIIKGLFIFTLGAAVGAFAANFYLKDKYEQIAQEEIDSVKEAFSNHPLDDENYRRGLVEEYGHDITDKDLGDTNRTSIIYRKSLNKKNTAYNSRFGPIGEEPVIDDPLNEDPDEYIEPYLITVEEYSEENDHFEKITIYYYDGDDTLADEQEEIISNATELIGEEALLSFGEGTNAPDTVLVRNERLGIDYEVLRLRKNYKETVLGFIDSPRRRRRYNERSEV